MDDRNYLTHIFITSNGSTVVAGNDVNRPATLCVGNFRDMRHDWTSERSMPTRRWGRKQSTTTDVDYLLRRKD